MSKLKPLLKKKQERVVKKSKIKKETKGPIDLPKSLLVWIPFDLSLPITDYYGIYLPPSVTSIGTKKGIVAYRNTSKYEADGELLVDHIAMATKIEPGTSIYIQRMDKSLWKNNCYYIVIDASAQVGIFELLPGDDDQTIRFVSTHYPEGPHRIFPLESIIAMFSIVDGSYLPKPKRYK